LPSFASARFDTVGPGGFRDFDDFFDTGPE
jgi:hypothetical protein